MFETIIFSTVFLLTYFGVEIFRRWSLRKNLFDVPNERSSHKTPTPRGGGVVIVLVCLIFYALNALFYGGNFAWSYLVGATLIAVVSWLDDLYSISFVWRLLIHCLAAGLVIFEPGFWTEIYLPFFGNTEFGFFQFFGSILAFSWIVWLTNAYNFMDGIDGIAGVQALAAGIGWFLVGSLFGLDTTAIYGGILAFSAIGFLIHNWQPAKIFMGDVGSAFLGFTFACLPFLARNENAANGAIMPLIAILLVWFFVFDSVFTFIRRLLKKQKVWTAHREHLYQKMVIAGRTHAFVAGLYGILSLILVISLIFWLKFDRNYSLIFWLIWFIETIVIFFLTFISKNVDERGE